jgi:cell division protein FtsI (penicillin-binding protein 3)
MLKETRLSVMLAVFVAFAAALVVRSGYVQLWQRGHWQGLAARQHYSRNTLAAPRGDIVDVAGLPLAESQVLVRLAVVPPEVKEPRRLSRALQHAGVDQATVRRVADRSRKWVEISPAFLPSNVASITAMPGVRSEAVLRRSYLPSDGIRKVVGRTDGDGNGLDGVEAMLDSLLQGQRGSAAALVDVRGRQYESMQALDEPPRPGHTVRLTLSYPLQDICDRAIADATSRLGATGGDIVMVEPQTGEVRCLASRRGGAMATASTALTEPFEPGSTLKPLLAGILLESGKAKLDEVIATYNGEYRTFGRTIHDVHGAPRLSLADVIRYSSNVGIVRFTERFSRQEMFEALRNFGFGTPTGISYPSEASGMLYEPRRWSLQSQASMAIGYEVAVTPIQLAMAYAAIANGGKLLVPALIKEVTDPDGDVVYSHQARVVRRVLEPETSRKLRTVLASVVDSGTATDASLSTFSLGGKSGTARRATGGVYGTGSYVSTFVGTFPAEDPQFVVLVKIDNPRQVYYGGKAAAPVAKAVIEAAIAARDAAMDRSQLITRKAQYVPPGDAPAARQVRVAERLVPEERPRAASAPTTRYALVDSTWAAPRLPPARIELAQPARDSAPPIEWVAIPNVRGLPLRVAVRELHRAGLNVVVSGAGSDVDPPPGSSVVKGSRVRIGHR